MTVKDVVDPGDLSSGHHFQSQYLGGESHGLKTPGPGSQKSRPPGPGASGSPVTGASAGLAWPAERTPYEPTPDELGLLHSRVPGHRWNGWRRLTGDEGYYAACSCGWRSTETGYVSPMLRQVQEHLDAVRAVRSWRAASGSAGTGPGRARERRQPARPAATARA